MAALIEIESVTRTFAGRGGQSFQALRGVTLRIAGGEYVVVLGKSGSGKSTLLNLVAGLDHPNTGCVRSSGVDLRGLNESALAVWRGRNIGIVFQFFQLLPTLTALENIVLAMEFANKDKGERRPERALDLLRLVGLEDQAHKLPSTLSGGQQQRAAIARAMANDPPIVVADEPTGNLDSETAAQVDAIFGELASRGKTLLIVTHDESLAKAAHRVVQLKDGIVATDSATAAAAA